MRVIGYIRVSTDRQAEDGLGLEVQERSIRRWAKQSGHRVVEVYGDAGVSGAVGVGDRSGLTDALAALEDRRAEGVVVATLDRLARKLTVQEAVLAHIWASGSSVFSVLDGEVLEDDPDDPMRTAIRQMRGVFSQLERAMIAKRLRDGRKRKGEKGGYAFGSPPFGWRAEGKTLVPVDDEQDALRLVVRLRNEGRSLREIAAALDEAGHRPQRGEQWHPAVLARVCRRASPADFVTKS